MALTRNINRFQSLKAWLAKPEARAGLARLEALGVSWDSRARTDEKVQALARGEAAPALPPVETYRDMLSFLAGVAWTMAWIGRRASR